MYGTCVSVPEQGGRPEAPALGLASLCCLGSVVRSRLPPPAYRSYGFGICIIGIAPPVTCGICPFHFFVSSYCTRFGVMLCARS